MEIIDKVVKLYNGKKKDNVISYDSEGKIIIPVNQEHIHIGYARIERVFKEAPTYYRVLAKNIFYDYYPEITPGELVKVFKIEFGYKVLYRKMLDDDKRETWLYNLKYKSFVHIISTSDKILECKITAVGFNILDGLVYIFPGLVTDCDVLKMTNPDIDGLHTAHELFDRAPDSYRTYKDYVFDFDLELVKKYINVSDLELIFDKESKMYQILHENGILGEW